eukprot:894245-Rhodomonas_salina.3
MWLLAFDLGASAGGRAHRRVWQRLRAPPSARQCSLHHTLAQYHCRSCTIRHARYRMTVPLSALRHTLTQYRCVCYMIR